MTREEAIEVLTDMRRIRSNTITEACDMAISALEVQNCNIKTQNIGKSESFADDIISRAEAITFVGEAIADGESWYDALNKVPSVSANPTVIRCTTFWNEEDFKEWADRIKEQNKGKNIVVIPCEAECVSAERVGEWEHWGSPFSDESEVIDTIVCSVCGARFIEPKDEPKGEYNYCPNCGARMENDDDDLDGLKIIAIIDGKGGAE